VNFGPVPVAVFNAGLWRDDCVTTWPCDELTLWKKRACDELTGDELTEWRLDRVTRWPCDELTGNLSADGDDVVITDTRILYRPFLHLHVLAKTT